MQQFPSAEPSLQGCFARLERVEEQLSTLEAFGDGWIRSTNLHSTLRFDRERTQFLLSVDFDPPPLVLGVMLGEVVHNLRATLDNLVWQVVAADGGVPTRSHAFPIAQKAADFAARAEKHLSGMSAGHVEIVRSFQPFAAAERHWRIDRHGLAGLNRLSNRDKHQILHPVMCTAREVTYSEPTAVRDIEVIGPVSTNLGQLFPGDVFMTIPVTVDGPNPLIELTLDDVGAFLTVEVWPGLPEDEPQRTVVYELRWMASVVGQVVDAFAAAAQAMDDGRM